MSSFTEIKKILRKSSFFQGFSDKQIEALAPFISEVFLKKGEFLIQEGEEENHFFLIMEGEVEILKKDPSSFNLISIGKLGKNEVVGEMVILGEKPIRSASVRALQKTHLIQISGHLFKTEKVSSPTSLKNELTRQLTKKLITSNETTIHAIQEKLEQEKTRANMGSFLIHVMTVIFLYIYTFYIVQTFHIQVISTSIISIPLLFAFGLIMLKMMKSSGYPFSFYGFTMKGTPKNLLEATFWSIPICLFSVLIKWTLMNTLFSSQSLSLFHISPALNPGAPPVSVTTWVTLVAAYCLFIPIQEIIFRGAMQSSLMHFLLTKHKRISAIVISNLPFSLIHLHLSLSITASAYMLGLFWGWLYARQKSLIGCSFSHLIIGIWNFFILGIQDVFII